MYNFIIFTPPPPLPHPFHEGLIHPLSPTLLYGLSSPEPTSVLPRETEFTLYQSLEFSKARS
jgi:hypothetical protein